MKGAPSSNPHQITSRETPSLILANYPISRNHPVKGTSRADRAIWEEFRANPESLAFEAEQAAAQLGPEEIGEGANESSTEDQTSAVHLRRPRGDTEVARVIRARRVQAFFRVAVLTSYDSRCAISGIGIPELLNASHIIPWSASIERRADPTNGLCLNALFDRAFDRGLITIDEELRVIVAKRLLADLEDAALQCDLTAIHGRPLTLPTRFRPDGAALAYHRESVFAKA